MDFDKKEIEKEPEQPAGDNRVNAAANEHIDTPQENEEWQDSGRDTSFLSFPVDLSREEYVRFNLIVSKMTGLLRFQKGQLILLSVLSVISLTSMFIDALKYKLVDPLTLLLILFLAGSGGLLLFGLPSFVRRAAERAYDQTVENGQSYFGFIFVYPDRLEKHGAHGNVCLQLDERLLYIETSNMMILISPNLPAIVLPARCLTTSDAEEIRRIVTGGIPLTHQKLTERMVPMASGHISAPANDGPAEQDTELLAVDVAYTRAEFIKLAVDTAGRGFMRLLPVYSGFSIMAALFVSFLYSFRSGVIAFVVIIIAVFVWNVLGIWLKAKGAYTRMADNDLRIGIRFTDQGIAVRSLVSRETIRLAWSSIIRAVERKDTVEFYTRNSFLRIPKRCFADFNELKTLVDSHICTAKK